MVFIVIGLVTAIVLLVLTIAAYAEGDSDYAYENRWPIPFSAIYDWGYDSDARRDARIEKNVKRYKRGEE